MTESFKFNKNDVTVKKGQSSSLLNQSKRRVFIIGCGKALPGPPICNGLIKAVTNLGDEYDESWAEKKIGIQYRHTAVNYPEHYIKDYESNKKMKIDPKEWKSRGIHPDHTNSKLSARAARVAIANANLKVSDIDLIIHSSCTPDYPVPSTATFVQEELGLKSVMAMDIRSACCGPTQAFQTAIAYLNAGVFRHILLIGMDVGTVFGEVDQKSDGFSKGDAVNAYLIGDGGGACVLTHRTFSSKIEENRFIKSYSNGVLECLDVVNRSVGYDQKPGMYLPAGGSKHPCCQDSIDAGLHRFKHDFRGIISHGPNLYYWAMKAILKSSNLSLADIQWILPHQANGKVKMLGDKMGIPQDKIYCNFKNVGNTANGSLYLMLDDLINEKKEKVSSGDLMLMVSAESTKWLYGAVLLRFINSDGLPSVPKRASIMRRAYVGLRLSFAGLFLSVRQLLYRLPIVGKYIRL